MKTVPFELLKKQFAQADSDEKIRIYTETPDLTGEQYTALLRLFPLEELSRLENALSA